MVSSLTTQLSGCWLPKPQMSMSSNGNNKHNKVNQDDLSWMALSQRQYVTVVCVTQFFFLQDLFLSFFCIYFMMMEYTFSETPRAATLRKKH